LRQIGIFWDRQIRITPADKGGAIVILDLDDYILEANQQLSDQKNYSTLASDPTVEIAKTSNQLLQNLYDTDIISENCYKWGLLDTKNVKTPYFYTLPKIHKNKEKPPGRPIVSGIGGPTERLSRLVDDWLQPTVKSLPSFLKDTTHFLQVIESWKKLEPLPSEALFVTIDVVGLYSNIPHQEVETSLRSILRSAQQTADHLPPLSVLLDIVRHILHNNVFEFEQRFYKQTLGTAMGTPMAPSIANVFMAWVEQRLLRDSPWPVDTALWRRFIDDIALLWLGGEDSLKQFLQWLNCQHPTIKFTANYGTRNIPFLDVSVSISEGRITTDLHRKETDAQMTLPFNSCHPRHCVRSIPFSQALRLRRICSEDSSFEQRTKELCDRFTRRGYPRSLVEAAVAKVAAVPREDTLTYKDKQQTTNAKRTPYIITHNPTNPPLGNWLRDSMPLLHKSRRLRQAVPHAPMVGERNCHNLRRMLMPSRAPPSRSHSDSAVRGCFPCATGRKCIICKHHLKQTDTFISTRTKQTFNIRDHLTCQSQNIIYLVDCRKCNDTQYVGETEQTLQKRFYKHRSDILSSKDTQKKTLIARHFLLPDHTIEDLACTAIEQIKHKDKSLRKQREKFWRYKLRTNFPDGLNVWDGDGGVVEGPAGLMFRKGR